VKAIIPKAMHPFIGKSITHDTIRTAAPISTKVHANQHWTKWWSALTNDKDGAMVAGGGGELVHVLMFLVCWGRGITNADPQKTDSLRTAVSDLSAFIVAALQPSPLVGSKRKRVSNNH
jgi:hypothetical protein